MLNITQTIVGGLTYDGETVSDKVCIGTDSNNCLDSFEFFSVKSLTVNAAKDVQQT